MALSSSLKFGFVDWTNNEPRAKEDLLVLQSLLVSRLLNAIDLEAKTLLPRYKNAKKLLDNLHERFSQTDGPKVQQ